jgi:membrane protein implicated in regulation of membrane protease activity
MIFGALLLGSELLIVDAGFYLVFIGIAAAITGLVELGGVGILMLLFRRKLYAKLRGSGIGYATGPAGEVVTLEQDLPSGDKGRLAYRGTEWTVINDSDQAFTAGQHVKIASVDGLTLRLERIEQQQQGE